MRFYCSEVYETSLNISTLNFANKAEREDWAELDMRHNFQPQTFLIYVSEKEKTLFMCMPQTQVYSEPSQTSKMELFAKIVNSF